MPAQPGEDVRLRAKYHDWCSARIVEQFLSLSPEEVYELARPDDGGAGAAAPGGAAPAPVVPGPEAAASVAPSPEVVGTQESFQQLVQRVTEVLLQRTDLPSFEEWSAAYREEPGRFDAEMLGFWQSPESGEG